MDCSAIFTTQERPTLSTSFMVTGNQEQTKLVPFRREALFLSIYQACGHRRQAVDDATDLSHTVVAALPFSKEGMISRSQIAETTHQILSRFDQAAATYYRAYHLR